MSRTAIAIAGLFATLGSTTIAPAQWDFSISGYCSNNGNRRNLNPTLTQPNVTVYECWSIGIPRTAGLISVDLQTTGTFCDGLTGTMQVKAPATPEELLQWAVGQIANLNPPFPVTPCPPTAIIDYGRHSGNQSVYSFSIGGLFGGAPIITKHVESEMTWTDTITIESGSAQTISLSIGSVASILAAESFGSNVTEARAKVTVSGTIGPASVNDVIEVVSVSVIPEQDSIDVTRLLQLPLQPGVNTFPVQLRALAEVTATAQGAGLIAGSSTAGVTFPNSLSFGPFRGATGGPLPNDLRIVSATHGTPYEDTTRDARWTAMGFGVSGASGTPDLAGRGPLTGGQAIHLDVSRAAPGAAALLGVGFAPWFLPLLGGWVVPDLALPGFTIPFATDGTGRASFAFPVPSGLPTGFEAFYQAWILDPGAPNGVLSATNGLHSRTPR